MTSFDRFLYSPFARALREVPWLGPVVSSVIIALLINTLSTTLTEQLGLFGAWLIIIVLTVALLVFVYLYQVSVLQRLKRVPPEIPPPKKYRGLIFIFSNNEPVLRTAIEYHQPLLEQCWLLATPEMDDRAKDAEAKYTDGGLNVKVWEIRHSYRLQDSYEAVCRIHQTANIPSDQIIADMTGGTKPMSAGMLLACLDHHYPLEHVAAQFDETGKIPTPARPIEIQLQREAI